MKDFQTYAISDGVNIVSVPVDRFKTNEIIFDFATPLCNEYASVNSLLTKMLCRTTKKYPTLLDFNRKLSLLYGATVSGTISKLGENQLLSLTISSLSDRFSLDNTKISTDSFELLMSLVFDANVDENGNFYQQDIEREKHILTDGIVSEQNEKRIYALRQLEKHMYKNEPYSINRYGSVEQVNAVTNDDLKQALQRLLSTAKIQITVVGNADIAQIVSIAKKLFSTVDRKFMPIKPAVFIPKAEKVNTVEERIKVKQGKLVLGFRVNNQIDFEGNSPMRTFADIFGGGPYSKLFNNVREKLSLCYYCNAKYDRRKSSVIVQCGCDEENMDKAVAEILNQLDQIKNGNFKTEFEASKIALTDVINGVNDSSISLAVWYANQLFDNKIVTPSQSIVDNNSVEFEQVQNCSKLLTLDTVFKLVPESEDE